MAHYVGVQATMTGTAIQVSTLFSAAGVKHVKFLRVQGATANVAATSVGGAALTTTTNIGATTGPVASVQQPIVLETQGAMIDLAEVYVVGANTEVAYLSAVL